MNILYEILLSLKDNTKLTRSSEKELFYVPRTRLKTYGDRAYVNVAPRLWNNLPSHITQSSSVPEFNVKLKSHLFSLAYNQLVYLLYLIIVLCVFCKAPQSMAEWGAI